MGCFVQILFPKKTKTAKYAGNWDPNAKQPISYKLQKWILSNTFLTRNMQVLVYGNWEQQSKNIKPFFTASYSNSEIITPIQRDYNGVLNFIFVGSLVAGKRPLLAIQIVEALHKEGKHVCLDLYGDGNLKEELQKNGVEIKKNCTIEDFVLKANKVTEIVTNIGNFSTDEVVLATGAWSPVIVKKLGTTISILPGKGYSFTLFDTLEKPAIPTILCEGKVAVTPMHKAIRYGGTMEITHTKDTKINTNRLQGIVNTVNDFYPNVKVSLPKTQDVWYGFRPCTPSGLPIICRDKKISNLVFATGHAMMGLSLAPATGKIVAELIQNKKSSVGIDLFKI